MISFDLAQSRYLVGASKKLAGLVFSGQFSVNWTRSFYSTKHGFVLSVNLNKVVNMDIMSRSYFNKLRC